MHHTTQQTTTTTTTPINPRVALLRKERRAVETARTTFVSSFHANLWHVKQIKPTFWKQNPISTPTCKPLKKSTLRREVEIHDPTPHEFKCPISLDVMLDPVLTADGQTYEKEQIEKWLSENNQSPLTNLRLPSKKLIPNIALRNIITKHFECKTNQEREASVYFARLKQYKTDTVGAGTTGTSFQKLQNWMGRRRRRRRTFL